MVLGSSHAFYGVNTDLIPNAANAANSAQTPKYDEYIFQKFAPDMPALKTVLIPLSYFTLFFDIDRKSERNRFYTIYWHKKSAAIKNSFEISGGTALAFKRIIRYYFSKARRLPCSPTGFASGITPPKQIEQLLQESGPVNAKMHTETDKNPEEIALKKECFRNIIKYCADKSIKVIVFIPPAWESYRNSLDPSQLQETLNFAEELTDYPNVTFLDLLEDNRFQAEDYSDADHMNPNGAEKLTKILFEFTQQ